MVGFGLLEFLHVKSLFMHRDFISVYKYAKKNEANIPRAILTLRLVNSS